MLRSATEEDLHFAERLYIANIGPLFREVDAWDEDAAVGRLRASFAVADVWIIMVDGKEAGWFEISEENEGLELHQIHLVPTARGRGIGTYILRCLMTKARAEQRRISLAVLPNNRARHLYRKLGFTIVGADGVKLLMKWRDPGETARSQQNAVTQIGRDLAGDRDCRPTYRERPEPWDPESNGH